MSQFLVVVLATWSGAQGDEPDLGQLARRLRDANPQVRREAAGALLNGAYRLAPPERLIAVLVETLKQPATGDPENHAAQAFVMEHLAGRFGAQASAALPHMLRMATDDKVSPYLRGQAIDASARIAPGDPGVVAALTAAIENPEPTSTSGVHDRAIAALSVMGKAAWPAKPAITKMLKHPWYQDGAYIALGKLALAGETLSADAALGRLAEVDRLPVEEASAAFLRLAALDRKDAGLVQQARKALWPIVASRGNDLISRAALRTLVAIGPGSSVAGARTIVRCLFTRWDPNQGDINRLAEAALQGFEATDKDAAPVFADAFGRSLKESGNWTLAWNLARALARFGPAAAPAAPHLVTALRSLPEYHPTGYGRDLLEAYTELAAVLGAEPGVRATVVELLDPASKVMKTAGDYRWAVHGRLLLTLGRQGLPQDGPERAAALGRIVAGLQSGHSIVFPAAARAIRRHALRGDALRGDAPLRPEEVREVLPPLTRALAFDFKFDSDATSQGREWMATFQDREPLAEGQRAAIQALAALGPVAREALPVLRAWAERPPVPRVSHYLPEPAVNVAIREAAAALKAFE